MDMKYMNKYLAASYRLSRYKIQQHFLKEILSLPMRIF